MEFEQSVVSREEKIRDCSPFTAIFSLAYQHSFSFFDEHQRTWQYITLPLYSLLAATFSSQWLLDTLSVLEIHLSKLNNNNNKNFENSFFWKNQVPIMRFRPFLGYMWRYGSVWCVKSWIWLKLKVKHETMGIIQDNLCHPYNTKYYRT